jgi:hypothetical protein
METKHTRVGAFAAARYSDGSQVMIAVSAAHAFLCRCTDRVLSCKKGISLVIAAGKKGVASGKRASITSAAAALIATT